MNESGRDERVRDGSEGEGRPGRWDRKVQRRNEGEKMRERDESQWTITEKNQMK